MVLVSLILFLQWQAHGNWVNDYHALMEDRPPREQMRRYLHDIYKKLPKNRKTQIRALGRFDKTWRGLRSRNHHEASPLTTEERLSPRKFFRDNLLAYSLDTSYPQKRPAMTYFLDELLGLHKSLPIETFDRTLDLGGTQLIIGSFRPKAKLSFRDLRAVHYFHIGKGPKLHSRFGHAAFRLILCQDQNKSDKECVQKPDQDLILSYEAELIGSTNPYWDGLWGKLTSRPMLNSFNNNLDRYNTFEDRLINSIPMKLTPEELRLFYLVLIEQKQDYTSHYNLFTNNCVTEANRHLQACLLKNQLKKRAHLPANITKALKSSRLAPKEKLTRDQRIEGGLFWPAMSSQIQSNIKSTHAPYLRLSDMTQSTLAHRRSLYEDLAKNEIDEQTKARVDLLFYKNQNNLLKEMQSKFSKESLQLFVPDNRPALFKKLFPRKEVSAEDRQFLNSFIESYVSISSPDQDSPPRNISEEDLQRYNQVVAKYYQGPLQEIAENTLFKDDILKSFKSDQSPKPFLLQSYVDYDINNDLSSGICYSSMATAVFDVTNQNSEVSSALYPTLSGRRKNFCQILKRLLKKGSYLRHDIEHNEELFPTYSPLNKLVQKEMAKKLKGRHVSGESYLSEETNHKIAQSTHRSLASFLTPDKPRVRATKKLQYCRDNPFILSSREHFEKSILSSLKEKKSPVPIVFCKDLLKKPRQNPRWRYLTGQCEGHINLIIGTRKNKGQTQFLLKNDWGKNCTKSDGSPRYHPSVDCIDGHLWVESKKLFSHSLYAIDFALKD